MDMEKIGMRNGGPKLPIGFRFRPTDEELIVHYLKRKVYALPLPASVIPEFDVFQADPLDLIPPGDESRERRYFFSRREGNEKMKYCNRISNGCGYWKAIGREKQIVADHGISNKPIGIKTTLVFHQRNRPDVERARKYWIMYEYRLAGSATTPVTTQKQEVDLEDWVVCCIYQKKRKAAKSNGVKIRNMEKVRANSMDFMVEDKDNNTDNDQPASSSCSSTSGISSTTEVSNSHVSHDQ